MQNQPFNQTQKPNNFWQKLKLWQRVGGVVSVFLFTYIIIIPILFCANVIDSNFSQNSKFVSCSKNSDCVITSCGCLNKKTVLKCGALVIFSDLFSGCLPPSSCSCQNNKCVSDYDYGNDIKKNNIQEQIVLTTDKTEYQIGEEVVITIQNNLNQSIFYLEIHPEICGGYCLDHPYLELFKINNNNNSGNWEKVECINEEIFSLKFPELNSKGNKKCLFFPKRYDIFDGKNNRYKIVFYYNLQGIESDKATVEQAKSQLLKIYSNEFTIKNDLAGVEELDYCQKDSDCEVYFSHCDCQYHCVNKDAEIEECDCICDETGPVISECVCENNKCVEAKFGKIDSKNSIDSKILEKENLVHDD